MKILILGTSGMLGSATYRLLPEYGHEVFGTLRQSKQTESITNFFPNSKNLIYNIDVLNTDHLNQVITQIRPDVIINCVGIIKQLNISIDPLYVLPINSLLPHRLAELAFRVGARLVHISTDCVFDGKVGNYKETDKANADDLYGKSKELGEIKDKPNVITLRTSLIGHELQSNHSLVDWFLTQSIAVRGFKKAIFSGLTTVEMAKVIQKYILPNPKLSGLFHLSVEPISKFDLLQLIKEEYEKNIEIIPDWETSIDRSLDSSKFREITGYEPGKWRQMIFEMKSYYDKYKGNSHV
ncbi:SDR family oxidoreductase [Leptospira kanakyensis]|uniref:dTDP-4-dehydrorhamnose reductase n=1 Tax=Leptospira kanakyensis TaxID=2484968 RepID=A0A6N4Q375_9LEPT|nr:SDR family oxidoreductase [Leptospira kanakyensis]TGK51910.1 SDR family oxidoreductase [Leptospira kanakyensis]TGK57182.1 SDR family oxidoreductase [Leptospira kanakyensis]TGK71802.1 SDR family oxidoreductase [Leptospira kanakyensis]